MNTTSTSIDLDIVKKKIATAKVAIITRTEFIFYTTILNKLKIVWDDSVKTGATDGIHLILSPTFISNLDHKQCVFLLMHELKHVIYKHVDRRKDRDPKMWNCAADYVINNWLDHAGFSLIPDVLLDHQYDGLNTDQVYFKLMERKKNDPSFDPQPDQDDLMPPNAINGGNGNPTDVAQIHKQIDRAIGEAVVQANMQGGKAQGNIPGDIKRYWEELTKPTVDWRIALRDFLFGASKSDYSWSRPSRRGMAMDLYLPSLHGQGMDCIDFAIDTSASVSESDFKKFISEIHSVFETFNPENIGIMQFDTDIKDDRRVCSLEQFKEIEFKGGGGTDVTPVLHAFKESEGKALVILTDGYFHHSKALDPDKPVIWAIYDNPNFVPAFGDVIHFNKDDLYDN